MQDDMIIPADELVNNPTARVPVCLCLDTSDSMRGDPIDELNRGVETFLEALKADEVARYAAEVAVVTFGGFVSNLLDFGSLSDVETPSLTAHGDTPMGQAVEMALDLLEARKREYSSAGVDYFQPWLVLMSDGQPSYAIEGAVNRINALVQARKLAVFSIGIGGSADMTVLSRFSPKRKPLRLKGLKFKEFFEWLSKSVAKVSQSTPGEHVRLDKLGIDDWGTP
jgi:uncharacterized protein YegL